MKTAIIILAAGKGKRMESDIPKVLHTINKEPMLIKVLNTAKKLNPSKILVIVGYKKALVKNALAKEKVIFINQKEQKGTGHAIKQCLPVLNNSDGNVLVLSGDVPLIRLNTLSYFIENHNKNNSSASLISTELSDPSGYGRIIKKDDIFHKITEDKEANSEEKKINEINSGIYIFDASILLNKIPLISNNNNQKEFYLTDIFKFMNSKKVTTFKIKDEIEISGVNTSKQLKFLEGIN